MSNLNPRQKKLLLPEEVQKRAQYKGLERKLKQLFGNCDNLFNAYEKKHNELKEVFDFLKILAERLGDISVSIKDGEKGCDDMVDEILTQLRVVIENREKEDKIQQDTLGELQKSQKKIMGEVETIKKNVNIDQPIGLAGMALTDEKDNIVDILGGNRYSQKNVSRKRNKRRRRKTKNRRRRK